jgi:hypothetical protein
MAYYPSNAKYERENLVAVRVAFNKRTEPELVERIEREDNKAGYIKKLVKEDIERERQAGDQSADH